MLKKLCYFSIWFLDKESLTCFGSLYKCLKALVQGQVEAGTQFESPLWLTEAYWFEPSLWPPRAYMGIQSTQGSWRWGVDIWTIRLFFKKNLNDNIYIFIVGKCIPCFFHMITDIIMHGHTSRVYLTSLLILEIWVILNFLCWKKNTTKISFQVCVWCSDPCSFG